MGDLSVNLLSMNGYKDDNYEWDVCKAVEILEKINSNVSAGSNTPSYKRLKYCEFQPAFEQNYQRKFFGGPSMPRPEIFSSCILLPPKNYKWPKKTVEIPASSNKSVIHWPNLGVQSYMDLTVFNPRYTKNVHHFNAPKYDIQQEKDVDIAARYIPFGKKIRTMLDIGAGGGSISFILNKRYDVTVLSTALPDFPYCEYIGERGGLCAFIDANKAMPFAKYSFDIVRHSWVFHSSTPANWIDILLDQNRILRPGGHLWIKGGLSKVVLKTIKFLLVQQLGYRCIYEKSARIPSKINITFGLNRFEVDWEAILLKPLRLKNDLENCR